MKKEKHFENTRYYFSFIGAMLKYTIAYIWNDIIGNSDKRNHLGVELRKAVIRYTGVYDGDPHYL